MSSTSSLEAIRFEPGKLLLLNQLKLPLEEVYEDCSTPEKGFDAIRTMMVRGAPAIALAAALSVAAHLRNVPDSSFKDAVDRVAQTKRWLVFLNDSRPTAVNLFEATKKLCEFCDKWIEKNEKAGTQMQFVQDFEQKCSALLEADVQDNRNIGEAGAQHILSLFPGRSVQMLTHCNTGSLATAGFGTALGVIRRLHELKNLSHAYCTETRPYNQGARLTAFELVYEKIPSTLITDSMASYLMKLGRVDAVVVGADRVTRNGDTANKIGTYQLAVAAKHHGIPFFVAAPFTSIDVTLATGDLIHIEERPAHELTHVAGVQLAAPGIGVWNPGFDVTPGSLIDGIFTEKGAVLRKSQKNQTYDLMEPVIANDTSL